jgi:hypothetical protein
LNPLRVFNFFDFNVAFVREKWQLVVLMNCTARFASQPRTHSISNNRISVLHNGVFSSSSIATIDASGNTITRIDPGAFDNLPNLQWIFMTGNQLELIPSAFRSAHSSLLGLILSKNRISELRSGDFTGMSVLRTLQVMHAYTYTLARLQPQQHSHWLAWDELCVRAIF